MESQYSNRFSASERGVALVYTALVLVVFLGILGFSLDTLNLQTVKQQLQESVDAAGLGAAYRLSALNDPSSPVTVNSVEQLAEKLLIANVQKKVTTGYGGSLTSSTIEVTNGITTKTVKINAEYQMKTFLMWLFSQNISHVTASATGQYSDLSAKPKFYIVMADTSGSMGAEIKCKKKDQIAKCEKIKVLKSALKNIIKNFPEQWGMSIIEFDTEAKIKKNMSVDINKQSYKNVVDNFVDDGETNFVDPLKKALNGDANNVSPIERAIALGMPSNGEGLHVLLITDGNPYSSPDSVTANKFKNKFKPINPNYTEYQQYFPYCNWNGGGPNDLSSPANKKLMPNDAAARFLESIKSADELRKIYPLSTVDVLMIGNKGSPTPEAQYKCTLNNTSGCSNKFPFTDQNQPAHVFYQDVHVESEIMFEKGTMAWPYLAARLSLAINTNVAEHLDQIKKDFPPPVPPVTPGGSVQPGFSFPDAPCAKTFLDMKTEGFVSGRMYVSQDASDIKEDLQDFFDADNEFIALVQ